MHLTLGSLATLGAQSGAVLVFAVEWLLACVLAALLYLALIRFAFLRRPCPGAIPALLLRVLGRSLCAALVALAWHLLHALCALRVCAAKAVPGAIGAAAGTRAWTAGGVLCTGGCVLCTRRRGGGDDRRPRHPAADLLSLCAAGRVGGAPAHSRAHVARTPRCPHLPRLRPARHFSVVRAALPAHYYVGAPVRAARILPARDTASCQRGSRVAAYPPI